MNKKEEKLKDLKSLYEKIFGKDRINNFNYENPLSTDFSQLKSKSKKDCGKCRKCDAKNNKQDVPYFEKIDEIKWMIVAECPVAGKEKQNLKDKQKYQLGTVFGWANIVDKQVKNSEKTNKYFNYFENVLELNLKEIYITDAVKCFVNKNKKERDNAFEKCKKYLLREIAIIKPKNIIWATKAITQLKEIDDTRKKSFIQENLKVFKNVKHHYYHPHFSQNISKTVTVAQIFNCIGEIRDIPKYKDVSKNLTKYYSEIKGWLK